MRINWASYKEPVRDKEFIMKRSMLLISLFFLSCAHQIDVPEINKSESVLVKDLRPAIEKESEGFSFLIFSDSYGIFRRGDAFLIPPAPRLLQHRVFEKLGFSQQPLELTIHHMVVYLNAKSDLTRSGVLGGVGGAVGAAVAAATTSNFANLVSTLVDRQAFESLAQEEYKRALYTETENPNHASVYVVYIDAEISGKRVFVKTMTPSEATDNQNALAVAVESTIRYYLSQY
jgi:hypothetical protein